MQQNGVIYIRSEITDELTNEVINRLLMLPNRLVLNLSKDTGLRIDDCLSIESAKFRQKMTITEKKTGKKKKIYINSKLFRELQQYKNTVVCGKKFLFPHRTDEKKHRTRQAVWYDIKRACRALRCTENITPHSMRKMYAVSLFQKGYSIQEIKEKLNHDSEAVTILYIMSELIRKN